MEEITTPQPGRFISALTEEYVQTGAYPAGGAVAALVAGLAASLAAAAADRSRAGWEEAAGIRAQAEALRRRAAELAERGSAEYAEARKALAERPEGVEAEPAADQARDWRLGMAVRRAADPPLELAAVAGDVAELAGQIAARGADEVRPDAVITAVLAAGAARAAAVLVQVNLVVGGDREPALRAARYADAADAAARRATDSLA